VPAVMPQSISACSRKRDTETVGTPAMRLWTRSRTIREGVTESQCSKVHAWKAAMARCALRAGQRREHVPLAAGSARLDSCWHNSYIHGILCQMWRAVAALLQALCTTQQQQAPRLRRTCSASLLRMPEMAGVTMAVCEKRSKLPLVVFQGAAAFCTAKHMRGSRMLCSAWEFIEACANPWSSI
jgi:hypothetical protein